MRQKAAEWINSILSRFGLTIQRMPAGKPIWSDDNAFCTLAEQIGHRTLIDRTRCFMLYQLALQCRSLEGNVAEIGVYKGGTARLISKVFAETDKTVHLFDTFTGMPPTDKNKDLHREGDFPDVLLDDVKKFLKDCDNIRLWPGIFPDTASPIMNMRFCFVHIDADIYKSVMDCCRFFYPRMKTGGTMIFDDYGFATCPGAKAAVDEFFSEKLEFPCSLPTGQCIVVKL
jgi:O-methyltransferase